LNIHIERERKKAHLKIIIFSQLSKKRWRERIGIPDLVKAHQDLHLLDSKIIRHKIQICRKQEIGSGASEMSYSGDTKIHLATTAVTSVTPRSHLDRLKRG